MMDRSPQCYIPSFMEIGRPVPEKKIMKQSRNKDHAKISKSTVGQGHSRVIICKNYDGQESPMLHVKFRGNQPVGSGEEDF